MGKKDFIYTRDRKAVAWRHVGHRGNSVLLHQAEHVIQPQAAPDQVEQHVRRHGVHDAAQVQLPGRRHHRDGAVLQMMAAARSLLRVRGRGIERAGGRCRGSWRGSAATGP